MLVLALRLQNGAAVIIHSGGSLLVRASMGHGCDGGYAPWPSNRQQKRTFIYCFDVVRYPAVQRYQLASSYFDYMIRQRQTEATEERLDGDSTFSPMPSHDRISFHGDQKDSEIRILHERLRTSAGLS